MQCSVTFGRDAFSGNKKMKTGKHYKNPYRKESNLDNIVDQLCTRLQDIKDQVSSQAGMPTCSIAQAEAASKYYAAFPALKKGQEFQYYLPPPVWVRKSNESKTKMQSEISRDWNSKSKRFLFGKERRNSYHNQRKGNKKRCNSYSRSFESQESMPEWMTYEGVWDMETQDSVREFIRAIANDEGYGTCENTLHDDTKLMADVHIRMHDNAVPDWNDDLDFDSDWAITEDLDPKVRTPMEEELYAKFEAKFDRSIEALWSKEQSTPDDEYQELPIDFQDLLSSPSDSLFREPQDNKREPDSATWADTRDSSSRIADALRPLHLADPEPRELETFTLLEGEDIYAALSTVSHTLRSFTAINHSRDASGFAEVPPRRAPRPPPVAGPSHPPPASPSPREDLLTAPRTHFRPIRREPDRNCEPRYRDGDTFDIRGELDTVHYRRSPGGGEYIGSTRYLEHPAARDIDYGLLRLTAAQRCPDLEDGGLHLRFPLRQNDRGVQTERTPAWPCRCDSAAKKMRPNAIETIWSSEAAVLTDGEGSECGGGAGGTLPVDEELSREWDELLSDISAARCEEVAGSDRKRRHSAARTGAAPACSHPHARFLHCGAYERPLTR